LRIDLPQGIDFHQNTGVYFTIVGDVEVSDSRVGGEVVVDELATEPDSGTSANPQDPVPPRSLRAPHQ
jgi:hypothetical protein